MVGRDVICSRCVNGTLTCTIPRQHRHHSLQGFEVGYLGRGPADLALNILAYFIPVPPDPRPRLEGELPQALDWDVWEDWRDHELDRVQLHDGTFVHRDAWELHQAFKREFIATMDRAGGTIPDAVITAWILSHRSRSA